VCGGCVRMPRGLQVVVHHDGPVFRDSLLKAATCADSYVMPKRRELQLLLRQCHSSHFFGHDVESRGRALGACCQAGFDMRSRRGRLQASAHIETSRLERALTFVIVDLKGISVQVPWARYWPGT
jgi:hypothetical protein